ncbi:MAG: cytochrome c [Proteobacteria bacterium]|nr:cytochrome c [Pseudomonadota bacterium]
MIAAAALALALTAADRGGQLADRACAACHATGLKGPSPNGDAPPFRALRLRYNSIALERRLEQLPQSGHPPMPLPPLSQDDAADLAAYIQTLTRRTSP